LVLHYQPIFDLKTGAIVAAEALVRWEKPDSGVIPPSEFIPLAEKNGLISRIGQWVLDEVCRQLTAWKKWTSPVPVAINVSAVELRDKNFASKFIKSLKAYEIKPNLITIEITESAILEYHEQVATTLEQFKNANIKIAIDDFGTGYSCLAYLKQLPLDLLKIDRSFVTDLVTDCNDTAIVSTVISMAHRLGMQVIAEGVESEAQHHFLSVRECDYLQGFHFSKPVPSQELEQLLQNNVTAPVFKASAERNLLLVDDSRQIINSLRRLMRNSGYRILTAETVTEALTLLASNDIHVVVAEQAMESAQATNFLGKVRDLYPLTVSVLLSGYTQLETIISSINNGSVYKFLAKPWDDQEFRETISEAFDLSDRLRRGDLIARRSETLMSTARLFWTEEITMGWDKIDTQHQQLFELHNRLNDSAWSTLPTPDIKQTLIDITALSKRHFADEEKMMAEINYPALIVHEREHQDFLRRLEWFSQRKNVAERTMLIDIASFIRTWITEHVELYDMSVARFSKHLSKEQR
ncbi:MAG: bacteriohemerythrin, partial [Motiliproteus sp.]|nr:bacteriohemerythrin [Motiliproteus sp.]